MQPFDHDRDEAGTSWAVVPPAALGHVGRVLVAVAVVVGALLVAGVADAAPTFRLKPGPGHIAVGWEVSVVPKQKGVVWYVRGGFWTRDADQWYRAPTRRAAWKRVAWRDVPRPLRALMPSDWRGAQHELAKAEQRRPPKPAAMRVAVASRSAAATERDDEDSLRRMRQRQLDARTQRESRTKIQQLRAAAHAPLVPRRALGAPGR